MTVRLAKLDFDISQQQPKVTEGDDVMQYIAVRQRYSHDVLRVDL